MSFIDDMVTDVADRAGGAFTAISRMVEQDTRTVLLRRFRRSYGKLTLNETIDIRDMLGHTKVEQRPCKVCRIMATEEFRRSQLED